MRFVCPVVLLSLLGGVVRAEEKPLVTTVGMPGRLNGIVLEGSELEAKPIEDDRAPLVLRIVRVARHGTAHRYDLEYYGLEAGQYDLRTYLRRKDGSPTSDLPPLPVTIESVLPAGQVVPHELPAKGTPWLGGYRLLLIAGGVLWLLGALAILFVGRGRKQASAATSVRVLSVADRLRPLIERALANDLSQTELAELERTLLAFWRRRLKLEHHRPGEAIALMRTHPEAGPLLAQLEAWLHRPGPRPPVDVAALLKPYQAIPEEALDAAEVREGVAS